MTNAIEEAQSVGPVRIRPSYGYYRQPNGWLTVSPAADLDQLHYINRGWTYLRQYGRIEMSTEYAADHPFEGLFMLGGTKEFSREQIIQSGMHLNPPLVPSCRKPLSQYHPRHTRVCMEDAKEVHFPQIRPEDLVPYPCHFCERISPTEEARNQHETVAHREERGELRGGEAVASALIKGFGGNAPTAKHEKLRDLADLADDDNRQYIREDTGQLILDVLSTAGMNKKQLAALKAAGLIEEDS